MTEESPKLQLPDIPEPGLTLSSGWFEVPEVRVPIHTKPELVGELLVLIADAVELGARADWFRSSFENAASSVMFAASTREYLSALVEVAVLGEAHGLFSAVDVDDVKEWAGRAGDTDRRPPPGPPPVGTPEKWDEAREALQAWIDAREPRERKKLVRQRSIARVTCGDCQSMLAWLVPQGAFDFLVLLRGDEREFEVGHAVGEYGGFTRGRCGRKGGRTWVLHADYLRTWLDEGTADMSLSHVEKGM